VGKSAAQLVRDHLRRTHRLEVGPWTPLEIIHVVRTTEPLEDDFAFEVRGHGPEGDLIIAMVSRSEIREAVHRPPR